MLVQSVACSETGGALYIKIFIVLLGFRVPYFNTFFLNGAIMK